MQIGNLIVPNINLNGDTKQTLLHECSEAMYALGAAIDNIPRPNGRNYQCNPEGDYQKARDQATRWAEAIANVRHEIEMMAQGIEQQKR